MNILVVSKTTNLELYGELIRRLYQHREGYVDRLRKAHDEHYRCLEGLFEALKNHKIHFVEVGRGHFWPELTDIQAVITVGGDGTVLEASHHIENEDIPLVGICSSSFSVGHLCANKGDESVESIISRLANGELKFTLVSRLRAELTQLKTKAVIESDPILNDFLFANVSPAATTRYALQVDGMREEQKSSGLWISTPQGSTAAISAAGGKKVSLEENLFQYLVREPYNPPGDKNYNLLQSLFHPDRDTFCIESLTEKAILAVDGQHGSMLVEFGDEIRLKSAPSLQLLFRAK